jgi:hypothetical protein
MNNPMQLMNMLKGIKSPKDAVINMIKTNNNPMVKNLVEMAEKGDSQGVENFARNLYAQQGRDFDKEFNDFMKNFK